MAQVVGNVGPWEDITQDLGNIELQDHRNLELEDKRLKKLRTVEVKISKRVVYKV